MDIYEHARSELKMHGTMLGNAGKCWKMLERVKDMLENVGKR